MTTPRNLALGPRGLHSLHADEDTRIACVSGSVWVTLDGDPRDIVLDAGESFTAPRGARAVVYAFQVSSVALRVAGTANTDGVRWQPTTAGVAV